MNEIAEPFDMTLPAVSRHIRVLERAGLLSQSHQAQYRPCRLDATPLKDISTWTEQYRQIWEARFNRMDDYLNQLHWSADDRKRND